MLARSLLRAFALLGLLLAVVTLSSYPLLVGTRLLSGPYVEPRGGTLIVLGADQLDTYAIGVTSYWRSTYATLLWRQGRFSSILICGGPPQAPVSSLMKQFLLSQGVPAAAVRIETTSTSTRENALAAAGLLKNTPSPKTLLTSDYHLFRAVRVFRRAGLDVAPCFFPDAGKRALHWQDRWRVFLDLASETVKIVWYKLHGWI